MVGCLQHSGLFVWLRAFVRVMYTCVFVRIDIYIYIYLTLSEYIFIYVNAYPSRMCVNVCNSINFILNQDFPLHKICLWKIIINTIKGETACASLY